MRKLIALFISLAVSAPSWGATVLVDKRALALNDSIKSVQTIKLDIDRQTERIMVKIPRETTGGSVVWDKDSVIKVHIVVELDGVQYRAVGKSTGGIRQHYSGLESEYYVLVYKLPWGFFGERGGETKRLGETKSGTFQAWIEIEHLQGDISTEIEASYTTAAAPRVAFHSSVAFDTATDAQEISGDGVLSLSHTSSGSDRAVFVGSGNSAGTPQTSTSVTYDGAAMTEMWDVFGASFSRGAGYRLANQSTTSGATVTNTLAASTEEHFIAAVSMTGVDQTSPVGTPATDGTNTSTPSVTVGSVGADDMVVDYVYNASSSGLTEGNSNPGANQTERAQEAYEAGSFSIFGGASTQSGADGGVMSWTLGSAFFGTVLGAVNFIASAGGGGANVDSPYRRILVVE